MPGWLPLLPGLALPRRGTLDNHVLRGSLPGRRRRAPPPVLFARWKPLVSAPSVTNSLTQQLLQKHRTRSAPCSSQAAATALQTSLFTGRHRTAEPRSSFLPFLAFSSTQRALLRTRTCHWLAGCVACHAQPQGMCRAGRQPHLPAPPPRSLRCPACLCCCAVALAAPSSLRSPETPLQRFVYAPCPVMPACPARPTGRLFLPPHSEEIHPPRPRPVPSIASPPFSARRPAVRFRLYNLPAPQATLLLTPQPGFCAPQQCDSPACLGSPPPRV